MEGISSVPANSDDSLRNIFQEPDWFASLSVSELDLLTSIKEMVIAQAKKKGCEDVAEKFSLDMYRGIGVILLEDLKERMKKTPLFRELPKGVNPLDKLPMMTSYPKSSASLTEDVCSLHFVTPKRKRKADGFVDGAAITTRRENCL